MTVIDFQKVKRERGEIQFMLCPHCIDETVFLPIVMQAKGKTFVGGLLCVGPECEGEREEIILENGFVV